MDFISKAVEIVDRGETEVGGDLEFVEDETLRDSVKANEYQKENLYNRLLPYDVTNESEQHFMRIKALLSKSILLDQEATYEWFIDLERFIDLYGLAFNKRDHIHLVKLHYAFLVSSSNMDLYYIPYVARCYSKLMRKRFLITPEELELDWRALYKAYERLLFSETEVFGLRFVPEILESNFSHAIRLSRPHFALGATQEMLDEWRPMLNPHGVAIQKAVTIMSLFLPTTLPPDHHDKGFKLWFEEVVEMWLNGKIPAAFEGKLTLLLSRLASDCLGYIDWEPYIPRIFNYFKTSLNLNGRLPYKRVKYDVQPCIQWIIYMISTTNSCLGHICQMFKAIESFYHPSNSDRRWHTKLQQFLYKLPISYVNRLYRERYKKNLWSRRLPESHRLTDQQTTIFVDALMPVVLTSMFNHSGINSASLAFRDLAILRPERVIPPLLDRVYGSYETLTEPHRLLSSINCITSVVPAMVRPCKYFPEGPSHVVPLLLNSLPGIDSNDMRKCIAVLRFVATLAAHIRMEDFSYLVDQREGLTLEQQQLCLSTSQFEDFVIQFLDKCFVLIENAGSASFVNLDQEMQSKNGEEGVIEAAISSVMLSILAQASPRIQQAVLDKLYTHITSHIFDSKIQGKAIATLCLACAKSNPKDALSKFVPYFSRLILALTETDDVFKETLLDEELSFSLLLMSEIVRCHSVHLLEYKDLILSVLHRSLRLPLKGSVLGCGILRHLLRALTSITCNDWRNIDTSLGANLDENMERVEVGREPLPFDTWGHTTHIKDLKLKWDMPTPKGRSFAQELLQTFLKDAVNKLLDWAKGTTKLEKEDVQKCLHVILSCLVGAASVLPTLTSEEIDLCPFEVPLVPMYVQNTGTDPLNLEDGTNIRTWVVQSMMTVLEHIKVACEDEIKSCSLICEIFGISISYFGYNKTELRLAAQRIKSMKSGFQNKLLGSKRHLRYLLVERVAQQHRAMLLNKGQQNFTQLHLDVLKEMFELSQSHYVEVRILSQDSVYLILNYFPFSENILVPMLVKELGSRDIEHNKFKGLLYLLLSRRSYSSIMIDPSWPRLRQLWPAVVESPHSEKPSIVQLLNRITTLVQKGFDTFGLKHCFSEPVKQLASAMWSNDCIDLKQYEPPGEDVIERVRKTVGERNEQNVQDYLTLVAKLVELNENPQLHWHRKVVAHNLFSHLVRDDYPFPLSGLKLCIQNLINERIEIRNKAVMMMIGQLELHKRKHVTRKVRFSEESFCTSLEPIDLSSDASSLEEKTKSLTIGEPEADQGSSKGVEDKEKGEGKDNNVTVLSNSNKWMQYKLNKEPYTKEEWERMVFIDKPHIGFYEWPKELSVYEPYDKQPKLDRPIEELNEHELVIYNTITSANFVDKLVEYFSFEEQNRAVANAGPETLVRADMRRPKFWKGLFRNYGLCILKPFADHIKQHATSSCEHKQRFVIEFLAGMVRASKHWSYEMMAELRDFVLTIIDQMAITQENCGDWNCFANYVFRHRDVRRFEWLLEFFITRAIDSSQSTLPTITPFILASRLSIAHYVLMQCGWRAIDHVYPIIIERLKSQSHLLAYTNLRNCLASIYSLIYMYDDPTMTSRIPGTLDARPRRIDFINFLLPKLTPLAKSSSLCSSSSSPSLNAIESDLIVKDSDGRVAQRVFKGGLVDSVVEIAQSLIEKFDTDVPGESLKPAPPVTDLDSRPRDDDDDDDDDDDKLSARLDANKGTVTNDDEGGSTTHRLSAINSLLGGLKLTSIAAITNGSTAAYSSTQSARTGKSLPTPASGLPASKSDANFAINSDASRSNGDISREERSAAVKVMNLTSCSIIYMVCRMHSPLTSDFLKLLPIMCEYGREGGKNPELSMDSIAFIAVIGNTLLSSEAVVDALDCIRQIVARQTWHARYTASAFLEIMVSSNFFILLNNSEWCLQIEDIIINHLIVDERVEVRETSASTLSGLIHCEFTKVDAKLIEKFRRRASSPLIKQKLANGTTVIDSASIVRRHSGILCLCACVDAYPYTVPDYLPAILTLLCDHLTDPQPISTTIKKTMSNFKRTHHDNWQSDKAKFTEDQLCVLADLLVSPSYYA